MAIDSIMVLVDAIRELFHDLAAQKANISDHNGATVMKLPCIYRIKVCRDYRAGTSQQQNIAAGSMSR